MATLKRVAAGWKGLGIVLNRIIDTVNADTPLEGDGIRITEGPGGKLISVSKDSNQPPSAKSTSAGAGGGPTEGNWTTVTVVDPDTCEQSEIQVWARPVS